MNIAERVQASVRAVNAAERDAIEAGSFTLYRSRKSDHPYLNYAVPNAGTVEWEGIDALRAAFAAHGLGPRLEFVAECAPGLEEALVADGFELQGRYPVMTLPAAGAARGTCARGRGHRARARGRRCARPAADGGRGLRRRSARPTRRSTGYGGRGHLARAGGEPAGAAFHSPIAEGVSELGGIGVRERFRRRGIAAALTAAAAAAAVAAGAELCFLTPGDDGAERVYARAGFARAGTTIVHMVG